MFGTLVVNVRARLPPWFVEYRVAGRPVIRTCLAGGVNAAAIRNLPVFEMQCVDCHNRTAHTFALHEAWELQVRAE